VRFFVLANGVNYPVGEAFDARAWRLSLGASPPRLPKAFVRDFEGLLRACLSAGVRLWPSLVSFELFQPLVMHPGGVTSGGRAPLIFGRFGRVASIEAFLDATLEPLLDAAKRVPGALGAFEVVNEPDWAVRGSLFRRAPVRASAMSRFVERGVRRIADAGLVATVGFIDADPRWLAASTRRELIRLGALGAYVHQLHHYPGRYRPRRLMPHAVLPIRPCLVGELATAQGTLHPSDQMRWEGEGLREDDAGAYLEARLRLIERLGYPGAFVWGYHSKDAASAWGEAQAEQLRAFAATLAPDLDRVG
jgi:hypothetical protein